MKRILAYLLVLAMAMSLVPAAPAVAAATDISFTVGFLAIDGATIQYNTDTAGWKYSRDADGNIITYTDSAHFVIPAAETAKSGNTTIRVTKSGMYYDKPFTLSELSEDEDNEFDVPLKTIRVYGIAEACRIGLVQGDWVYGWADIAADDVRLYNVFDNGRTYIIRLSLGGSTISITGIDVSAPNAEGYIDIDLSSYFGATPTPTPEPTLEPTPEPTPAPSEGFVFKMMYENKLIKQWCAESDVDFDELASGIAFKAYAVSGDGAEIVGDPYATGAVGPDGTINFDPDEFAPGWYAITEEFVPGSLAESLFAVPDALYVYFDGSKIAGTNLDSFDYGSAYWSTDAFFDRAAKPNLTVTYTIEGGMAITNPWFDDFLVKELLGPGSYGEAYSSFSAYYASNYLGGNAGIACVDKTEEFAAINPGKKEDILAAFNYIYDAWGSLDQWPTMNNDVPEDSTKFIAQIAAWLLLSDGMTEAKSTRPGYEFIDKYVDEVVGFVRGNPGYVGDGFVADIVYLAGGGYPFDMINCDPQIVPIYGGAWIRNQAKEVVGPKGKLRIKKTVDGMLFAYWLDASGVDPEELVSGIAFKAYAVNYEGADIGGDPYAEGVLGLDGEINFDPYEFAPGWYAIVEEFAKGSLAASLFAEPCVLYVYFNGSYITCANLSGFDYDSVYWATKDFFVGDAKQRLAVTYTIDGKADALNPWFDDFFVMEYFGPKSYGEEYSSFCAYYESNSLGGDAGNEGIAYVNKTAEFVAMNPGKKEDILVAFNYIYDTWGSLDAWPTMNNDVPEESTKFIAQIAAWLLLHDDMTKARSTTPGYEFIDKYVDIVVQYVKDNPGYIGSGFVSDIVFLADGGYPINIIQCQPQIVPIYGDCWYHCKPNIKKPIIVKTVDGSLLAEWCKYYHYNRRKLISGMAFYAYAVNGEGEAYAEPPYATGKIGAGDVIEFDRGFLPGWYAIVEQFAPHSLAEKIFEARDPMYISFDGENIIYSTLSLDPLTSGPASVNFDNKKKHKDDEPKGKLRIKKTVDGKLFAYWLDASGVDPEELVSGIAFKAYIVEGDEAEIEGDPCATGELGLDGAVNFDPDEFAPGWYAIVEEFAEGSLAASLFAEPSVLYIHFDGENIDGTNLGGFDYDSVYWATTDFFDRYAKPHLAVTYTIEGDVAKTNPWFDDFLVKEYFGTNSYGEEYSSFCAYYKSESLGGDALNEKIEYVNKTAEFVAMNPGKKEDILVAFNYIYETWGSLDQWPTANNDVPKESTKFIAQVAAWLLLHDDMTKAKSTTAGYEYINKYVDEVVSFVRENPGYIGDGFVTDIVYLADGEYPAEVKSPDYSPSNLKCQPQIVPIYGGAWFRNKTDEKKPIIVKTVDGSLLAEWCKYYHYNRRKLISGMVFYAYAVNGEGEAYAEPPYATGKIGAGDVIEFDRGFLPGWYAIVEEYVSGSLAEKFFEARAPMYISFDGTQIIYSASSIAPLTSGPPSVNFDNTKKKKDDEPHGKLRIKKTVDGKLFAYWLDASDADPEELLSGISFKAYEVAGNGAAIENDPYATGELGLDGAVNFDPDEFFAGWYAIVEEFAEGSLAASLFAEPSVLYIHFDGENIDGTNLDGFDYGSEYWSIDKFFDRVAKLPLEVTYAINDVAAEPNPWFDDFLVKEYLGPNSYGEEYSSFCAYYASNSLGGNANIAYVNKTDEFVALNPGKIEDILTAFNYIYETWGSLDQWPTAYNDVPEESTKFIAQVAAWLLLHDDMTEAKSTKPGYGYIDMYVDEVVSFVRENPGYIGDGFVSDIVYLADGNYPADGEELPNDLRCQPQIVPIFGGAWFRNKVDYKKPIIVKTVDGSLFSEWCDHYGYDRDELASGMVFFAYAVDGEGEPYAGMPYAIGKIGDGDDDVIAFNRAFKPGWYAIVEKFAPHSLAKKFFEARDPMYISFDGTQIIYSASSLAPLTSGPSSVNFDNKKKQKDDKPHGKPVIKKTVNGRLFAYWLDASGADPEELLSGITFKAYEVAGNGAEIVSEPYATGELKIDGSISFNRDKFAPGWYAIVEEFADDSLAASLFAEPSVLYIHFDGVKIDGTNLGGFDYDGEYWATDEFFVRAVKPNLTVTYVIDGEAPVNNEWHDDFLVKELLGPDSYGEEYSSFCAYYASNSLGGDADNGGIAYVNKTDEFVALNHGKKEDILTAFNYIYKTWGSLDKWPTAYNDDPEESTKFIAQVASWLLLYDDMVEAKSTTPGYDYIDKYVDEVVCFVRQNPGCIGDGVVSDIVFLADENYPAEGEELPNDLNCQPQIVPIYGGAWFRNKLEYKKPIIVKTVDGSLLSEWCEHYGFERDELVCGMVFFAYAVDGEGEPYAGMPYAIGKIGDGDVIAFNRAFKPGWYVIVEKFVPDSLASKTFVAPVPLYISFDGTQITYSASSLEPLTSGPSFVNFDNKPFYDTNIKKTVDGALLAEWCEYYGYDRDEIVSGMVFKAYAVDGNNEPYDEPPYAIGKVGANDFLVFDTIFTPGWYAIVEEFVDGSLAAQIFEVPGPMYIEVADGKIVFPSTAKAPAPAPDALQPLTTGPSYLIFDNHKKVDDGPRGKLRIFKTVDGQFFSGWLEDSGVDAEDLISGISFKAYAVAGDGAPYGGIPCATGKLNIDGSISFNPSGFAPGWYAIVEKIAAGSLAEAIFAAPSVLYVFFDGVKITNLNLEGFDYAGEYWSTDTFFDRIAKPYLAITYTFKGTEYTNPWADDFLVKEYFGPESDYGKAYSSFCAYYASESLGGDAHGSDLTRYYYVNKTDKFVAVMPGAKEAILAAYNYIIDTWGSLTQWPKRNIDDPAGSTKFIAQVATWRLLYDEISDVKSTSPGYEYIDKYVDEVLDFVAANPDDMGTGSVMDIVFLAHAGYTDTSIPGCQPQIVPIYEGAAFDNATREIDPDPGIDPEPSPTPDPDPDTNPDPDPEYRQAFDVSFNGVKGVTVQYYTNITAATSSTGWRDVPGGPFDDNASFEIPQADQATFGQTTVRVVKGGMSYSEAFELDDLLSEGPIVIDVPMTTIRVYGIKANADIAIVQNNWVYNFAPAVVDGKNYYTVFDNGKDYEVRLRKTGFYVINRPGVDVSSPNAFGYTDVYFGSAYFYVVDVPEGITNLRMQSNGWIHNKVGAADAQITLLRDVGNERPASMVFSYEDKTVNVTFVLDGTNPFCVPWL